MAAVSDYSCQTKIRETPNNLFDCARRLDRRVVLVVCTGKRTQRRHARYYKYSHVHTHVVPK